MLALYLLCQACESGSSPSLNMGITQLMRGLGSTKLCHQCCIETCFQASMLIFENVMFLNTFIFKTTETKYYLFFKIETHLKVHFLFINNYATSQHFVNI